jgi:hypothetical protein
MTQERHRLAFIGCSLLLAVLGFAVRLAPFGQYVTPDEPAWAYRALRFNVALEGRDWSAVPNTGHPGVTTMWLGATGVAVRRLTNTATSESHIAWLKRMAWLAPENGEAFAHLAYFLTPGRVGVALVTSIILIIVCTLSARLFGRTMALLTTFLLAFDPFLAGHSGLLHLDALLASFCLLVLLTALVALRARRPGGWWALSGVLAGLALLTKTPALVVLLFVPLTILYQPLAPSWKDMPLGMRLARPLAHLMLFAICAGVTVLALYPALWSDPLDVLQVTGSFADRHVENVQRPIFFAGDLTYDPGPTFYPLVLLYRVSPIVLAGVLLGLVRWRSLSHEERRACAILLGFAALFTAAMSLGAKKHDRYLLPALMPLIPAAALSLSVSIKRAAILTLTVLMQIALLLPFAAYPLTYFNPLLGGPAAAAQILPTDWGEGAGAAASWLNEQHPDGDATVAASNVPSFGSVFTGRTVPLGERTAPLADYYVTSLPVESALTGEIVYTAPVGGRDPTVVIASQDAVEQATYLGSRTGEQDIILLDAPTPLPRHFSGPGTLLTAFSLPDAADLLQRLPLEWPQIENVWLVASGAASPVTAAQLQRTVRAVATPVSTATVGSASIVQLVPHSRPAAGSSHDQVTFGARLALIDAAVPPRAAWPDSLMVTVRWQALTAALPAYRAVALLRDGSGITWSESDRLLLNEFTYPTSAWGEREWADTGFRLPLPAGIPPSEYTVEIGLYEQTSGAGLGAAGPAGQFLGTLVPLGGVSLRRPTVQVSASDLEIPERLNLSVPPFSLLGIEPPQGEVLSGDFVTLGLFWQADTAIGTGGEYLALLRLISDSGEVGLEELLPLSPYSTSDWQDGDAFLSRHRIHLPPELAPGEYSLQLNLLSPNSSPVLEPDIQLDQVALLARERNFQPPSQIPFTSGALFGTKIQLLGYELGQTEADSGSALELGLYWQASGPTEQSYTLFVHLTGPDGRVEAQVDSIPGSGAAPTHSWASGQIVTDRLTLFLPDAAPPGQYQLQIGFYDPIHGQRLPALCAGGQPSGDGRCTLPTVISVAGAAP